MKQLRGPLTVSDDHRVLSPTERGPWHCSRVLRENWNAFPCPDEAVVVYELPDGVRAGFCFRHKRDADEHARVHGWQQVAA